MDDGMTRADVDAAIENAIKGAAEPIEVDQHLDALLTMRAALLERLTGVPVGEQTDVVQAYAAVDQALSLRLMLGRIEATGPITLMPALLDASRASPPPRSSGKAAPWRDSVDSAQRLQAEHELVETDALTGAPPPAAADLDDRHT